MNEILNMRLFALLSEPSQEATPKEMQNAYECFLEQLRIVSQSEQDYSKTFRTLNISRIELIHLQTIFRYEQGGKMP
jgi:hypothetical protein